MDSKVKVDENEMESRSVTRLLSGQFLRRGVQTITAPKPRPLAQFKCERYFAWDFAEADKSLTCSDMEPLLLSEVKALEPQDSPLMLAYERLSLAYTPQQGTPELREAIARGYHPRGGSGGAGSTLSPDNVVIAAPQEGIFLGLHALLEPGDHVVAAFPSYQSLFEVARSVGCEVDLWEPSKLSTNDDDTDGSADNNVTDGDEEKIDSPHFCVEELKRLVRPDTKAVVVNFPHNPTGALPTLEEWEAIVECCRENGAWLFSDEMYRGLEHGGDAETLPAACEVYEKGISLGGMSKTFSLPGLRIGWLAFHPESTNSNSAFSVVAGGGSSSRGGVAGTCSSGSGSSDSGDSGGSIDGGGRNDGGDSGGSGGSSFRKKYISALERVLELKDYTTICAAAPSELLATIALKHRVQLLERSREIMRTGLEAVREFCCERHPEVFVWCEPRAGPFAFPRLRGGFLRAQGVSGAKEFCDRLAREEGIMLLPSVLYDEAAGDERVRITYSRRDMARRLQNWERAGGGKYLISS
jgi:aspartate/methionine/tyrosine aminotransferase